MFPVSFSALKLFTMYIHHHHLHFTRHFTGEHG